VAGMIALLPADPAALTLDADGAEPEDQIHLTLAFLGDDVATWDAARHAALTALVQAIAATAPGPISAEVIGHATFRPGHEKQCAVHLAGDSALLGPIRDIVCEGLAAILGDDLPAQHLPWIPHLTAGYGLTAADLSYTGPVMLDRITVALGGDWATFPLGPPPTPATEALTETDDPGELTDDEAAAAAAAAQLAVRKQRDKTHDRHAALLAVLLADFAKQGLDGQAIVDLIDPDASRADQRATVAAEIARQARISGHDIAWHTLARDAHTAAVMAGTAAAAHIASAGQVDVEPGESPYPDPFDPAPWVLAQQAGLAGDIVDAAAAKARLAPPPIDPDEDPLGSLLDDPAAWLLDPDEVADLIDAGAGALYYLDTQMSDAYLDAETQFFIDLGLATTWWICADSNACSICQGYEARSPYTVFDTPSTPHGGCRCFITIA